MIVIVSCFSVVRMAMPTLPVLSVFVVVMMPLVVGSAELATAIAMAMMFAFTELMPLCGIAMIALAFAWAGETRRGRHGEQPDGHQG